MIVATKCQQIKYVKHDQNNNTQTYTVRIEIQNELTMYIYTKHKISFDFASFCQNGNGNDKIASRECKFYKTHNALSVRYKLKYRNIDG